MPVCKVKSLLGKIAAVRTALSLKVMAGAGYILPSACITVKYVNFIPALPAKSPKSGPKSIALWHPAPDLIHAV